MQDFSYRLALVAGLALAGCAGTSPATDDKSSHMTGEMENRRQLCQKWTGNPDDPECLSTFRRILP